MYKIAVSSQKRAVVVINRVRKPLNRTYKEIKALVTHNYPELCVADTELSQLRAFAEVLANPLCGQAVKEIKSLINEIIIK